MIVNIGGGVIQLPTGEVRCGEVQGVVRIVRNQRLEAYATCWYGHDLKFRQIIIQSNTPQIYYYYYSLFQCPLLNLLLSQLPNNMAEFIRLIIFLAKK
jgi:hypothetical protein